MGNYPSDDTTVRIDMKNTNATFVNLSYWIAITRPTS